MNSMIMRAKWIAHGLFVCWSGYVENAGDTGKASQCNQPTLEA